jgi:hypothetical protein
MFSLTVMPASAELCMATTPAELRRSKGVAIHPRVAVEDTAGSLRERQRLLLSHSPDTPQREQTITVNLFAFHQRFLLACGAKQAELMSLVFGWWSYD